MEAKTPFGAVPSELAWLVLRHTGPTSLALRLVSKATRAVVDAVYHKFQRVRAGRITLRSHSDGSTQECSRDAMLARLHAVRRLVGPAVVSVECSSSYDETRRMVTFPGTHHVDALVAYVRAHPTDTVEVSIGTGFLGRDATRYATEATTACGVNAPRVRSHAHREPVHRMPDRARLTEAFERLRFAALCFLCNTLFCCMPRFTPAFEKAGLALPPVLLPALIRVPGNSFTEVLGNSS
jgi:hypothetical protein